MRSHVHPYTRAAGSSRVPHWPRPCRVSAGPCCRLCNNMRLWVATNILICQGSYAQEPCKSRPADMGIFCKGELCVREPTNQCHPHKQGYILTTNRRSEALLRFWSSQILIVQSQHFEVPTVSRVMNVTT